MSHVQKYTKSVYFHFETVRKIYQTYLKSMNIPKTEPFKVMDIGCGSGRVLLEVVNPLLPKNCEEIIATDKDQAMIDYCKSMKVDPKISFEKLDMDSPSVPEKFKQRFDILFSNYCFQFLRNMKQGLQNSNKMLKPKGELLFLFNYPGCPPYYTYKKLSKMPMWQPYTNEFADYNPHFAGNDRDSELKMLFNEAGLNILSHEFRQDHFYETTAGQIFDLLDALNILYEEIPEDKKDLFKKDYRKVALAGAGLSKMDERNPTEIFKICFSLCIVHAKKE